MRVQAPAEIAMRKQAQEKEAREAAMKARQVHDDAYNVSEILSRLHVAAQALANGRISSGEKIKHQLKKVMLAIETKVQEETALSGIGLPASSYSVSAGPGELKLPEATSVQQWSHAVEKMIPVAKKLTPAGGCLPADFKKQLAALIKQGRMLCAGTSAVVSQAAGEIAKATHLYTKLSGTSYL